MKKKQQSSAGPNADHIRDTIRTHFLKAAASEKPPFNLSGRGHEPRVHLSAPLATALRGLELPRVYIAGFGAKYSYPLRVVKRAAASLKKRLHRPVIEFDSHYQTAFLDSHFIPHREPAPEPAICDPSKWTKIGSTNERDISELLLRWSGLLATWREYDSIQSCSFYSHVAFNASYLIIQDQQGTGDRLAKGGRLLQVFTDNPDGLKRGLERRLKNFLSKRLLPPRIL